MCRPVLHFLPIFRTLGVGYSTCSSGDVNNLHRFNIYIVSGAQVLTVCNSYMCHSLSLDLVTLKEGSSHIMQRQTQRSVKSMSQKLLLKFLLKKTHIIIYRQNSEKRG